MSPEMKILLFGDQATDYHNNLRKKLHQKNSPVLSSFFDKTKAALREEVSLQSRLVRDTIPSFSNLLDLVDWSDEAKVANPAVESAICTTCQIACLISYLCQTSSHIDPSDTRIIGSCTGLLAAVVASSSPSVSQLPTLGVALVRIAFRAGLLVADTRNRLQQGSTNQENWSVAVKGLNEDSMNELLRQFNAREVISASNQAYISAIGIHSLTVSGPPSTLERLADSVPAFSALRQAPLPIHGPYHSEHLYGHNSIETLLEPFLETLDSYVPRVPIFSSYDGNPIVASSALGLIQTALEEMLRKPLHWRLLTEHAASEMKSMNVSKCTVFPAGPAEVGSGLISALKNNNCVASQDDSLWLSSSGNGASSRSSGKFADSKIAIVGMAGRFPSAANHEAFWELLEKGIDTHKVIPGDRFDQTHVDPTGSRKNTSQTPYGCFIDEPGLFDPRFFRMSPREATQTDPMHRLAILTAYEALEMSGFVPNRTPSTKLHRVGTFYGQTSDDWREIQEGQEIDTYFIPGGVRAFAPGRINYFFKFSGPSFSVDTACSSSFAALQLAVTTLRAGDCDTAVTGGMNVLTNPDIFSGLSRGQFLSKTGNCRTFDNEADGYCRGEAVASVILKRLEDAEADKDNILGVILESATNHSADAVSITHPHAPTQEYLYKQLLTRSGLDANDVSYVEMHGTGTQAGDKTEMESVTNVFAARSRKRRPDQPLNLGAVKANIGHGEAASGVCALIKVLLMMEKNAIPPNCGIKRIMNQEFPPDLAGRNVHIPVRRTPWPRSSDQIRRVFVSNFSAAGGNTGLLMEDAPLLAGPDARDPRSMQIVTVSGKSKSSLRKNLLQLVVFITENPTIALPSLSYTTTARRMHYNYRMAVTGPDLPNLKAALVAAQEKDVSPISPTAPDVAFVFTGQGSHYAGLGRQLFEESSQFRTDILQFDNIAQSQGFPSVRPLIDGTLADISGLSSVIVQLGSVCVQMALARLWISWGVVPAAVLGHSLGEYAALNVAGVLSASDTIYLVGKRACELERNCTPGTHAMLAVATSISAVEPYMTDDPLEVACINSSEQTVIGGSNERIDRLAQKLSRNGVRNDKLQIPFAFHVSQVDPVLDIYEKIASGVTFNTPLIPVVSPLLKKVVRSAGSFSPAYVRRHARETVNFPNGLDAGFQDGVLSQKTVWVEVGPHPVCLAMVKKTLGPTLSAVPSLRRNEDTWKVLSGSLATLYMSGLDVDWNEYQRDFNAAQQLLRLPTYGFDLKNYWIHYTGNWCLTKGDARAIAHVPEAKPKLSTTSVQRIVEESIQESEATVTIESDIAEATLKKAFKGHQVNDTALCPSSIYADMALTVAEYLHKQLRPNIEAPAMSVGKMEVGKSLTAGHSDHQLLRVHGEADLDASQVKLQFYSTTSEGQRTTEHAKCVVSYIDAQSVLSTWKRYHYLIKPRIETLLSGVNNGTAEKIHRNMAYSLFGSFVQYSASYRGMEEVTLDLEEYEATAKLVFQTTDEDGKFFCSPYWIDSIGHISGFVVNVKEALGDKAQVFISHGWESMCFARPLSKDKVYRSYVKMQPQGGKVMAGDVVLFDGDEIVGVIDGLKFQSIPRTLLDTFLPPSGGAISKPVPAIASKRAVRDARQTKPKKQAPTPVPATQDISSRALDVVAAQVGVPISELSDNVIFADIGVDSLMSLTIAASLREELDMEIDSTLFTNCPSVADFLGHFSRHEPSDAAVPELVEYSTASSSSGSLRSKSSFENDRCLKTPPSDIGDEDMIEVIRATIADEMGIEVEEIVGETDLVSLGMDSLLTLTVLAKLRETTGRELSPDFFFENPSVEAIINTLSPKSKTTISMPAIGDLNQAQSSAEKKAHALDSPPATSLLLQGNPKTATKTLFLFPDGSGSATSYAVISKIAPNVAVYGLNCPFMKTPEKFLCGIDGVSALYKAEVRRRQPKGPYYLGGWSAGGVVAYEVSLQLIAEGETIARLILLDSPCPIRLEPLPARLHVFLDQIGLLGTGVGAAPKWLLPHFEHAIRALDAYKPAAMDPRHAPPTFAVWATEGVCPDPADRARLLPPQEDDPKSMNWLLEDRTDFGSNGWDQLIPGEGTMRFATIEGNHFTMMRQPAVEKLAALIRQGLE
ncbi:MAG: hypothetical protein LQ338_006102 [Usnochroma carphineum]|nr:MAG: hypothetical protein LQ338_006102 [Usnochroma carphineum]